MKQLVNIEDLGPRTRAVMEYIFEHPKASTKEIAQAMGVSESRIYQIKNHPRFLAAYPSKARKKRQLLIPEAVQAEQELLHSQNDEVRRKVVASVYADHKISDPAPTTQINVFQNMSQDDLMRKVERINVVSPDVIDTTLIEPQP